MEDDESLTPLPSYIMNPPTLRFMPRCSSAFLSRQSSLASPLSPAYPMLKDIKNRVVIFSLLPPFFLSPPSSTPPFSSLLPLSSPLLHPTSSLLPRPSYFHPPSSFLFLLQFYGLPHLSSLLPSFSSLFYLPLHSFIPPSS